MQFKAIFWDLDGTLVDTERMEVEICVELLWKDYAFEISTEDLAYQLFQHHVFIPDLLVRWGFSDTERRAFLQKRRQIYQQKIEAEVPLFPGVRETLETLHKTHFQGIVTGSTRAVLDQVLLNTKLDQFIDFRLGRDEVGGRGKVDPRIYEIALERAEFKPEEVCVVEDTSSGIASAQGAGMYCFGIETEFSRLGDLSRADKVLKSIPEILKYVN